VSKIKLLHHPEENTAFSHKLGFFPPYLAPYFDILYYDPAVNYNPQDTVIVVPVKNQNLWWQPLVDQGFKIVIENLTEVASYYDLFWPANKPVPVNALRLTCNRFFSFADALTWQHLGYANYVPQRHQQHKALILMGHIRAHRDLLLRQLGAELDNCLWSYIKRDRSLDDINNKENWTRSLDPNWFNSTCFSIVAETRVNRSRDQLPFITEKTYKPIAMQQPFMILGDSDSLGYLKREGYETFDNLWSEQYDRELSFEKRIDSIVQNTINYNKQPLDKLTEEKVQHNRARFFDPGRIAQAIYAEMIEPVIEYANKT